MLQVSEQFVWNMATLYMAKSLPMADAEERKAWLSEKKKETVKAAVYDMLNRHICSYVVNKKSQSAASNESQEKAAAEKKKTIQK